jgi:hypothetical protein
MKGTKDLALPIDVVLMGSQTLECTIFKGLVTRLPPPSFGNEALYYLTLMHASQNNEEMRQFFFCYVHITHHVGEGMNIFHSRMTKAAVPKL